jgi:hypothetical protein
MTNTVCDPTTTRDVVLELGGTASKMRTDGYFLSVFVALHELLPE